MPTTVTAVTVSADPQKYEDEYVHSVYDEIAPHFSSTRYKPWPIIARFLSSLPAGWVGLDSGTGNGKYLPLPPDRPGRVWTIGLDRSRNLLEIAQTAGEVRREVVWGDVLDRPWRNGAFDYAISIATIHHLSTAQRRKEAVKRLLECVSPRHGRALIYVWAIEQDELSKRKIPSAPSDEKHPGEGDRLSSHGQDVFVPWVLASHPHPTSKQDRTSGSANDHSLTATPQTTPEAQDYTTKAFNRYYHMFSQGELSALVYDAARELGMIIGHCPKETTEDASGGQRGIEIVQDGWERSNYYVELRRWES